MVTCNQIMCKYDLNTREDTRKFILKNHPDKGGEIDTDDFNKIIECYNGKSFCKTADNKSRRKLQ